MERTSGTTGLVCPLCGDGAGARGCANCHLSLAEIRQYGRTAGSGGRVRAAWTRFIGLVVYAGMAAWSWWFMPTVFLFVLPGAIVGGYLHTIRGRTIAGALACLTIVVIVPLLLLVAGFTGLFADVTGGH